MRHCFSGGDVKTNRQSPPFNFEPGHFTRSFWDACERGVIEATRCNECEHLFLPAGPVCPRCWSTELGVQDLSGYGEVATFTVYRQSYHPDFQIPYVVALIALREGPRLISNIVDCAPEDVNIGMSVLVRFEPKGDLIVPKFAPADASTHTISRRQKVDGSRHG